jgi:methionine-rich copper-binding protein CopC
VRGARWLIFAVCVVAAFSGLAVAAGAHAALERSAPADGAVLGSSPGVAAVVFDEPVGISLGRGHGLRRPRPTEPDISSLSA